MSNKSPIFKGYYFSKPKLKSLLYFIPFLILILLFLVQSVQKSTLDGFEDWPNMTINKPSYLLSIPDMKTLYRMEGKIYSSIKAHVDSVKRLEKRLEDKLRNWIVDYEQSTLKGLAQFAQLSYSDLEDLDLAPEALNNLVSNPIITHRMIHRFSTQLILILDHPDLPDVLAQNIAKISSNIIYPNQEEDYKQSMESLLRIQIYNSYSTRDLADGKLGHLHTNITLNSVHAYDLSIQAKDFLALKIEWLEIALKRFDEEDLSDLKFKKRIHMDLKELVKFHDILWKKVHKTNGNFFNQKIASNYGSHLPSRTIVNDLLKLESIKRRNVEDSGIDLKNNFQTLCSGKNYQSEIEKSKLHCWLGQDQVHPYWIINPLKIELLNKYPPLIQIYEVIGSNTIQWLIKTAIPELTRSLILNGQDQIVSDIRTSSQAWISQSNQHPIIQKMIKKIEFITGLNVRGNEASEELQVASYGPSHHYDEHLDALENEAQERTKVSGDRITTFMFYLNDVTVGGKTGFPMMGTAANPIAGSALFWYNLKRNGEPDSRTWHGGCPVVHGIKWVANKWILHHQNWDKRKCSLNSEE